EFWRRWHISLTTWFRDYVYIPLGGSRVSKAKVIRNTFVIFLVSGFWHGANWTFVAWGAFHALLFLPLILLNKNRKYTGTVAENRFFPTLKELFQMLLTFALVVVGWIFFRAESIGQAAEYLGGMFSSSVLQMPFFVTGRQLFGTILLAICMLVAVEWINRHEAYGFKKQFQNRIFRRMCYMVIVLIIAVIGGTEHAFIYFQF
ncbi:MAG: MBOAT family protein, partial [Cytophagaceae bacterium]|nr:MBOAT family protein [Cytophagaceae bacterium]